MSFCVQQVNVGNGLLRGAFLSDSVPGAIRAGVRRKGNFGNLLTTQPHIGSED